ncbi:MAG: DNA-directed RNA polymerase subunit D [Candidatus Altiarchaeota archaeon]
MNVKLLKKGKTRVEFNVKGVDIKLLNTLRRIVISEIPTMAIEKVIVDDNNSVLHDQLLAHRLGLIPLTTDLKTYIFPWDCSCKGKGCGKCTAILSLDVKGPGVIHTSDMKSKDPKVKPVYDTSIIAKLSDKHRIKLKAEAVLGQGRDHIKWQSGLASYLQKKDDSFDFFIESYGQLPVKELTIKAFTYLEDEITELKKQFK